MSLVSFAETAPVRRSSSPWAIVPRRWSLDAFRLSSGPSWSRGCDRSRLRSDGERVTVMLAFSINIGLNKHRVDNGRLAEDAGDNLPQRLHRGRLPPPRSPPEPNG